VELLKLFRTIAATAAATASGAFTMATGGSDRGDVTLAPGDVAPEFELAGSDGRTYRLRDYHGRDAVVIAWFPKAFTGG
jgi:thioredoxin-dependent peroxiredoxin